MVTEKFNYPLILSIDFLKKIKGKILQALFIVKLDDLQHMQNSDLKTSIHVYTISGFINTTHEGESNILVAYKA